MREGFKVIQIGLFNKEGNLITQKPIKFKADGHIPSAELKAIYGLLKTQFPTKPTHTSTILLSVWSSRTKKALKDFHFLNKTAKLVHSLIASINMNMSIFNDCQGCDPLIASYRSTLNSDNYNEVIVPADDQHYSNLVNEALICEWQKYWTSSNNGRHCRTILPEVQLRLNMEYMRTTFVSTQYLTGHGNFRDYVSMRRELSPDCGLCGARDTADHRLFICTGIDDIRQKYGISSIPNDLLTNEENYSSFMTFINEIHTLLDF